MCRRAAETHPENEKSPGPSYGAGTFCKEERRAYMDNNLIRAQKPDWRDHLEKVSVSAHQKEIISRLRETGHALYHCSRGFKTLPN